MNNKIEYFEWSENGYGFDDHKKECTIESVEINHVDPENYVFYCKNKCCGKYHKICESDLLKYAIYYMEVEFLEKKFVTMAIEEIENIKLYKNQKSNILERVIFSLGSVCGGSSMIPTLDNVSSGSFCNPYMKFKKLEIIKCEKYLRLLNLLCKYLPHLITDVFFTYLNSMRNYECIKVLNDYSTTIKNDDDVCVICFGNYEDGLIDNICYCKNKIHISCLTETIKKCGDDCKTCKKKINNEIDSRGRICFPFENIYWSFLCSNVVIIPKNDLNNSLIYACSYLMIDRVIDLLDSTSDEEFMNFKNQYKTTPKDAKYYIDFKFDANDFLIMTPYPASNMSIDEHEYEHNAINNLLKKREQIIINAKNT